MAAQNPKGPADVPEHSHPEILAAVEANTRAIQALDIRVGRLEKAVERLEGRVERLEKGMSWIIQKMGGDPREVM